MLTQKSMQVQTHFEENKSIFHRRPPTVLVSATMRCPPTGVHRPASPRPICSVDVRRAAAGDKVARKRLQAAKYRAVKRRREIEVFDEAAAGR